MTNPVSSYNHGGKVYQNQWIVDGELHREDGPAVIEYHNDGSIKVEQWIVHNSCHRIDAPAIIWYHKDGTVKEEQWVVHNKWHKIDGPAITSYHNDGTTSASWHINDIKVSEEDIKETLQGEKLDSITGQFLLILKYGVPR